MKYKHIASVLYCAVCSVIGCAAQSDTASSEENAVDSTQQGLGFDCSAAWRWEPVASCLGQCGVITNEQCESWCHGTCGYTGGSTAYYFPAGEHYSWVACYCWPE